MGSCFSIMGKKKKKKDTDDDPLSLSSSSITSTSHLWKKRSSSSATNANADPSVLLHIPGRLTTNGATKLGCLYTQQGKKGTNQDAMLFWENFSSTTNDTLFCGVFDGHGPYGHLVAKKVRDSLPLILSTRWNSAQHSCLPNAPPAAATTNSDEAVDDESFDSLEVDETEKQLPDMYLPLKKSLLKAFKLMDKELKLHPTIDCFCSGTTAVTLIKQGQDLVIGNVGDSRAVLATRDQDDSLLAVQLTVDLKPDLPREAARILQCKGRVFALQDEPEVPRVWLPNNDSPGLAMARAFDLLPHFIERFKGHLSLSFYINMDFSSSKKTMRISLAVADAASCYCAMVLLGLILLGSVRESSMTEEPVKGSQFFDRPCDDIYVVGEGETLNTISEKCDDPFIVEQNPHIHDPDDVYPGLVIKITSSKSRKMMQR